MKLDRANSISADVPNIELSADLDWMLQSQQISDSMVAEALVETHFQPLLRFAAEIFANTMPYQWTFNKVVDELSWAVHHRRSYWGGSSVTVWLYAHFLKQIRKTKDFRQWTKQGLRLLLCDHIGMSPAEADAILSKKRRAAEAGSSGEDQAQERLAFARRMLSESDRQLLARASEFSQDEQASEEVFVIPGQEDVVLLVLETSRQAGMGRIVSRNLLQGVMLGGLVLALVTFVLYRTTIEQRISAQRTPVRTVLYVTWTPDPRATPSAEVLVDGNGQAIQMTAVPGSLVLEELTGSVAEEYFRPEYSGLLALSAVTRYWDNMVDMYWLRAALQPDSRDTVVMFYELSDLIKSVGFEADFRLGGDIYVIRSFIDAGFPVIAQIGYDKIDGWDGQFVVVSGYDNERRKFMVELLSLPAVTSPMRSTGDMMRGEIDYDAFNYRWEQFSGAFLLVYRPEHPRANMDAYRSAMEGWGIANEEGSYNKARIQAETRMRYGQGRSHFFSLFSYATILVYLQDYGQAASYYDLAFERYDSLPRPNRPYRMMWYQTRPYWAYYYSGDYAAVVALADRILEESGGESALEETYYWRALGREGLGDVAGAISDLEEALKLNTNFAVAQEQLNRIRVR